MELTEWWEVRCQLTTFGGTVLQPKLFTPVNYHDSVTGDHRSSDEFATVAEAQAFADRCKMKYKLVHCVQVGGSK